MQQRISLVTLAVADLGRSRRFYGEGLGWKAAFHSDEVVFFQTGGSVLALYGRADLARDAQVPPERLGPGGVVLAHNVRAREEVDVVLAEAAAAGAVLLASGSETAWGGYVGYFADPDGHLWEVAWNPHWPLEADGSVRVRPT